MKTPEGASDPTFDALADEDHSSEAVFNEVVQHLGGVRTTDFLGQKLAHQNADWVFPDRQMIVEHKQIEAELSASEAFRGGEVRLRLEYAKTKRASPFALPHNRAAFSREYIQLYRNPLSRIIKKANIQVRQTRQKLGWPKGNGILILSNLSLLELTPLSLCLLIQQILGGAYSEVGAVAYVTNHYLQVEGSERANVGWFPIYKDGGESTPAQTVSFVDELGAAFFKYSASVHRESTPITQIPAASDEALRVLTGRPVVPRSRR